ncbi:MAG: outer membrane protein assembly factor BamD [Rikenellaceae bacterium]|jgi:outer membrane protein assembly factor BamD|nr:outer membrane protein assembly factor BamD [Rikenellaceae bacterium]
MKRGIAILILALVTVIGAGSVDYAVAQKPTKEEKRHERERKIAEKATRATELRVKEGKRPSYNKLLRSTNYELMWREGLVYYNATKKKDATRNTSSNYQKAQNLFTGAYQSQFFAGKPQEDSLLYYLGASYYKDGIFEASEQYFDRFRRLFPSSAFIEDVEYMYAMGFYFSSPKPELDQTNTLRAMIEIGEYQGRYPNTVKSKEIAERMEELQQKLYTKSYDNAKLYYTIGQYKAAAMAMDNAIDENPASPYREELMYLATKSSYLFAKNSVASQMTDRYLDMMDDYYNLISEFPATAHLREVEKMRDEATEHISKHTQQDEITPQNGNQEE